MKPKSSYFYSVLFLEICQRNSSLFLMAMQPISMHLSCWSQQTSSYCYSLLAKSLRFFQPLSRAFFKHFKTYYIQEAIIQMRNYEDRNIMWYQVTETNVKFWENAAPLPFITSGFKQYFSNANVISVYFFSIENHSVTPSVGTQPEHSTSMWKQAQRSRTIYPINY